ncbi:MAG: allophanate hydrolase [Betaproteobacteria bacterium]
MTAIDLSIATLRRRYAEGLSPVALVEALLPRFEAPDAHNTWIARLPREALLARAHELEAADRSRLPLYGIPFAIKDNIDLAGVPTTAACPDFAYVPSRSATVVQRLLDAGAIALGKANLDQFATGLVGARSPHGPGRNSFDPAYVSGGSSSGSALAVALGLASFSLGTDTAGSGRVPAAFNNLVGHKPTLGLLSARGAVPACRSLDTVSIFALCAGDAQRVLAVAAGFDAEDGYSREARPSGFDFGAGVPFRFGVPREADLEFFGDADAARLFGQAVERLRGLGGEVVEFDLQPFLETARLLYEGPWVAERYAAIREFFDARPDALHPVTRAIVERSRAWLAADAYAAQYRLRDLARVAGALWSKVDCALTPTAGTCYTIAAVEADPIRLNSNLGYYPNFMNLLDLSATSVPAGFGGNGLPFGVTLFAPAHRDLPLLHLADRLQRAAVSTAGAVGTPLPPPEDGLPVHVASGQVRVAVCGAHLSGLPLNGQLASRGARLVAATRSAPCYRFYALPGGPPERPGMVRVAEGGGAVELEVWELPAEHFGSFVAGIPAPLGIGTVLLEDGSRVQGFVCEAVAAEGARDITALGGWRAWLASKPA